MCEYGIKEEYYAIIKCKLRESSVQLEEKSTFMACIFLSWFLEDVGKVAPERSEVA